MSKLSEIKEHTHTLGDIKNIMNAMKNLSIVEMTKIARFLPNQAKVAGTIQQAMADFETFYGPSARPEGEGLLCVLLGSERGFCGGFNEQVAAHFKKMDLGQKPVRMILVGRKLAMKFEEDPRVAAAIGGPSTAEEIPQAIYQLCESLRPFSGSRWLILHNDGEEKLSVMETYPLEAGSEGSQAGFPYAPLLNLPPAQLYPLLMEQRLLAVLYRIFYLSFMAENRERLRHMDGALEKIENDWNRMRLKANALRQEQITEELEIIIQNGLEIS